MTLPRIGLLGGSFDPVHRAHIALALTAQQTLALEQVRLLPAANPWQRQALFASAQQRLHMLALATAPHPSLYVDACEIDRGGKTYTIDTVSQLPSHADYVWILGSDQLRNFCTWHRWQEIVRYVNLAVALRPDAALVVPPALVQALKTQGRTLATIALTPMPISASSIRQRLSQGLVVDSDLDPAVLRYITQHQLYQP